jgi:rare lipoprotein A
MDARFSMRALGRGLAPLAALVLLGSNGTGFAQEDAQHASALMDRQEATDFPIFVPSPEPVVQDLPADNGAEARDEEATALGEGVASYYASRFHGRRTASGETFDNGDFTAAHRTLPFGSRVRVTNPRTGQSVVVRINDRGPFTRGRTIDLSRAAAEEVGIVRAGHGTVQLELLAS